MNRLFKACRLRDLGVRVHRVSAGAGQRRRGLGLALRRLNLERLDQGGRPRRQEQLGSCRRGDRRQRPGLDALQPQGRLQELPLSGRGQDQRQRQLGDVLPQPTKNEGDFSTGYEAQIDSTHSDPIRTGSIYGFVHIYKQIVPPDTWFTYEVECVDKNWRGSTVPHIKVWINGELLYELQEKTKQWDKGISPSSSTTPAARSRFARLK